MRTRTKNFCSLLKKIASVVECKKAPQKDKIKIYVSFVEYDEFAV